MPQDLDPVRNNERSGTDLPALLTNHYFLGKNLMFCPGNSVGVYRPFFFFFFTDSILAVISEFASLNCCSARHPTETPLAYCCDLI